jgi:hypothetical protein
MLLLLLRVPRPRAFSDRNPASFSSSAGTLPGLK